MNDELLHIPEEEYQDLIRPYTDAMNNVRMRLEVLNKDYRKKNNNYPIHFIQTRIKKRASLEKKLMKKDLPVTALETVLTAVLICFLNFCIATPLI